MTNWPTAPLVHITQGKAGGLSISNALAARDGDRYTIVTGHHAGVTLGRYYVTDQIIEYQEVTPIPTPTLELLAAAFAKTNLPTLQATALQAVTSYVHPYTKQ